MGTLLVLTKFYNDVYYSNKDIATVGGVSEEEINRIEEYLLELIDYRLFIREEEYQLYESGLLSHFNIQHE